MPSPTLLYACLIVGVVANLATTIFDVTRAHLYLVPGNVVAALISAGAIALVRWRQRRGWDRDA